MVGSKFSEKQDPKESCKPQQEAWASLLKMCVEGYDEWSGIKTHSAGKPFNLSGQGNMLKVLLQSQLLLSG